MAHQSQEEEEDVADAWVTDLSITIQPGKIKPCASVSVELFGSTKEKYSKYMGLYTLTDTWANGRPVFKNAREHLLYAQKYLSGGVQDSTGKWVIGNSILKFVLLSIDGTLSPTEATHWSFYNGKNSTYPRRISGLGVYWGKGESHKFSKKA